MNRAVDDLISRAAAIAAFDDERVDWNYGDVSPESVIKVIESIPAVNTIPVMRGRWLEERPNTYMRKVKCSVCNGPAPFICRSADYYGRNMHGDFAKTKYCPCCGARMETKNE